MGRFFHRSHRTEETKTIPASDPQREMHQLVEQLARTDLGPLMLLAKITGDEIPMLAFEVKINRMQTEDIVKSRRRQGDIRHITESIATYLHDNQIPNIVLLDRSARTAYIGLSQAWKKLYPDERRPGIYFMNPDATRESRRYDLELELEFKRSYPGLVADLSAPVMVFDVCMHHPNGATDCAVKILKNAGFKDVRVGLAQPKELMGSGRAPEVDFFASDRELSNGCYPFGRDLMTEKGDGLVVGRETDLLKLRCARELRETLIEVVR